MIEVKVSYTKFLYHHRETLFLSSHGLTFVCVCVLSQDVRDLADPWFKLFLRWFRCNFSCQSIHVAPFLLKWCMLQSRFTRPVYPSTWNRMCVLYCYSSWTRQPVWNQDSRQRPSSPSPPPPSSSSSALQTDHSTHPKLHNQSVHQIFPPHLQIRLPTSYVFRGRSTSQRRLRRLSQGMISSRLFK